MKDCEHFEDLAIPSFENLEQVIAKAIVEPRHTRPANSSHLPTLKNPRILLLLKMPTLFIRFTG
jgi:hypothetical protein